MLQVIRIKPKVQKSPLIPQDREYPIFNLNLTLTGWQGPFQEENEFSRIASYFKILEPLWRSRGRVTNQGHIILGETCPNLHTSKGEIDLSEISDYNEPHIHFDNGALMHLDKLRAGRSLQFKEFMQDPVYEGIRDQQEINLSRIPRYTLSGLYGILPNQRATTKISALQEVITHYHQGFQFDSIATRKDTRVKLLERAYRRFVSNQ